MKSRLLLAATLLAFCSAAEGQEVHRWWVEFTDKAGSPYSIENPSEYLSPRALERRNRLGIAVDSLDLPVNPAYLDALRQTGGTVWTVSRWLNGAVLYTPDSTGISATLGALPFVADVKYYSHDSIVRESAHEYLDGTPVEPQPFDTLYGPEYYGLGYSNIDIINGIPLHRAGYKGEGILIGVCDGGFPGMDTLEAFADLRAEGRLVATRDFVYGGDNVFDVHSHGTRVLSNMATCRPGIYVGTAPKASYALCRTEDTFHESPMEELFWAAAMEFLDSLGVDVTNTSLNYISFDNPDWNYPPEALDGQTSYISRAANVAATRGILVVVSAGNTGYNPPPNFSVPADSPEALVVGAIDENGERALFSSYGTTADGRQKPDVMAPGKSIWTILPDGTAMKASGTSFSSPITAGMAACVIERYPTLGPAAWCDSIRAWGDRATAPHSEYGYGTPDFGLALGTGPGVGIGETPQPADDAPILRMELYDATGRCLSVRQSQHSPTLNSQLSILNSPLPRGVYLLRLITPNGTRTRKIVKP